VPNSWNTSQINRDTKDILRIVDKLLSQSTTQAPDPPLISQDTSGIASDGPAQPDLLDKPPETSVPVQSEHEKDDTTYPPYTEHQEQASSVVVKSETGIHGQASITNRTATKAPTKAPVRTRETASEPRYTPSSSLVNTEGDGRTETSGDHESSSDADDATQMLDSYASELMSESATTGIFTPSENESGIAQSTVVESSPARSQREFQRPEI
jgi:hypothetical protein